MQKGQVWAVVGGADSGGLLVREGQDLVSAQLPARLETGAVVEQVKLVGGRLNYVKVSGIGPQAGWVSLKLKGKELLVASKSEADKCSSGSIVRRSDLDGQSLGPWPAHAESVSTVLFDRFSWQRPGSAHSRRLFSSSWAEARVCCWELSSVEQRTPLLLWELPVRGLVSDIVAISSSSLLTAVSANPLPETGSACHQADFKKRVAEQDDQLGSGDTLLAWNLDLDEEAASATPHFLQKFPLHVRGCHKLSVWPGPSDGLGSGAPQLLGSISKDVLCVSRISPEPSCSTEALIAAWRADDPYGKGTNTTGRHLCWESTESLWTGDEAGVLKVWDVSVPSSKAKTEVRLGVSGLSKILLCPTAGLLIAAHEDGIAFVDTRAGQLIRHQYTKEPVTSACLLDGENWHPVCRSGL
ncbi:unnamed protein product [Polarella glacialis]|uniref:Uncharacterized protein n=1 Tax=Polarella glacialis TaxID=89957 RepID=A0A813CZY2_POLGL|nr:unnamed protein product [Polarella glacialis]